MPDVSHEADVQMEEGVQGHEASHQPPPPPPPPAAQHRQPVYPYPWSYGGSSSSGHAREAAAPQPELPAEHQGIDQPVPDEEMETQVMSPEAAKKPAKRDPSEEREEQFVQIGRAHV